MSISLHIVPDMPDIAPGDRLAAIIGDCLASCGLIPRRGDILCIAQKIFSKAEGCIVRLRDVRPSQAASRLAARLAKDPRKVHVILRQSRRVLRAFKHAHQSEGTLICQHLTGVICANAGIDESNLAQGGTVLTLPRNPDASAARMHAALTRRFGLAPGIVMTDSFGRPWRRGQVNVAIGLAAVPATCREPGNIDGWGRPLSVTEPAFADEIAAASGLAVRKAARTPVILIRGLDWQAENTARATDLLRNEREDMFK